MLERAVDERRPQPGAAGAREVERMRGDEHELRRLHGEQLRRPEVDLWLGLVGAGELGGRDRVEAQVSVSGEVHEQRHVAVGQRRGHALAPEELQALADVGPRIELVPAADELRLRGGVDRRQAARGEQLVERRAVQLVEGPGRALPAVGLLERRRVTPAPVVGQIGRVPGDPGCGERPGDLERQSTSVPKTSKTSARTATRAD